jgi:hypothetical protein
MSTIPQEKLVACKLTAPELRKRKEEAISALKNKLLEKVELKDGYKYTFEGSDTMIDILAEFIKAERQCCGFLTFDLMVGEDKENLWLTLTGPNGAKEFIKSELKL